MERMKNYWRKMPTFPPILTNSALACSFLIFSAMALLSILPNWKDVVRNEIYIQEDDYELLARLIDIIQGSLSLY